MNSEAEFSGAVEASSSSLNPQGREEGNDNYDVIDDDAERPPQPFPHYPAASVSYNPHSPIANYHLHNNNVSEEWVNDDTWSCIIVILTFWGFVSMTLIVGVYGSGKLCLGPNSSILIKPNTLFVEHVTVEEIEGSDNGPKLYGVYEDPPLDVVTTWSEVRQTSLPPGTHKEWMHYLNVGSQINISYSVKSRSSSSSSLVLVIAQGNEGLAKWFEDPSFPNTTLSWNIIRGNGLIQEVISKSSSYYVAVGNLNSDVIKVELNLSMRALLYDTTGAYYECSPSHGKCSLRLFFLGGNAALLTSPGLKLGMTTKEWYIKVTYGPRWMSYLIGIGAMTVVMLLVFHFMQKFRRRQQDDTMGSQRTPLLAQKDDDLASLGSSYDSVSQDDEEPDDGLVGGEPERRTLKNRDSSNIRRLCAICYDAPRDCFFLPCGHCVACFACGTTIAEAAGTCPICRRRMKKVRKIFVV